MGGINHQPTRHVSMEQTVPAARALSQVQIELWSGNVEIEELVMLTGKTTFGAGHGRLQLAHGHFASIAPTLEIVRSHIGKVIDTVANPEYEPFDLALVGDIAEFIGNMVHAGLLPSGGATDMAIEVTRAEGYRGMFFAIGDLIEKAMTTAQHLADTTRPMIDGPEGKQGYFWDLVETGENSWRQDFFAAFTAVTTLTNFWATTGAICTQAHMVGAHKASLLDGITVTA